MPKVRLQAGNVVEFNAGQIVGGIGRGSIVAGADLDAATELDASHRGDFVERRFERRDKCAAIVTR